MSLEACRRSPRRGGSLALVLALVILLLPANAWAYLDPGTGSILIQGVIAALVGAGFLIKMFWQRVKALFTGKPQAEADEPDD